jgi:hypothetical protein
MFSRRNILFALVLLPRLLAQSADASDAFERYNARLDVNRSLVQTGIWRNSEKPTPDWFRKSGLRAGERQIKELGMMRSAAIAEAKLIYEN